MLNLRRKSLKLHVIVATLCIHAIGWGFWHGRFNWPVLCELLLGVGAVSLGLYLNWQMLCLFFQVPERLPNRRVWKVCAAWAMTIGGLTVYYLSPILTK